MRKNIDKNITVVRALRSDPARSNYVIAEECAVAESVVRRQRQILESCGLLEQVSQHVGADGMLRPASFI